MALERDPTEGDTSPSRDLPAPYVSPWSELGRTLTALVADVRLRILTLWRRNGEGSLLVPDFWPRELAPSFWPLLLVLLVLCLLVLGRVGLQPLTWAPSGPDATLAGEPAPVAVSVEPAGDPALDSHDDAAVDPNLINRTAVEPEPDPEPEPEPVMEPEIDPLVSLLITAKDPADLLLAAITDPSNDNIQLQVAAELWWQLTSERREQLARGQSNRKRTHEIQKLWFSLKIDLFHSIHKECW